MSILELNGRIFDASTTGTLTLTSEGGAATTDVTQGLVKSWSFLSTAAVPALTNSFNCSSVSDDATGNFTITLSSAMQGVNQCATGMVSNSADNPSTSHTTGQMESASTLACETLDSGPNSADINFRQYAISGDLA